VEEEEEEEKDDDDDDDDSDDDDDDDNDDLYIIFARNIYFRQLNPCRFVYGPNVITHVREVSVDSKIQYVCDICVTL
jgi:hypothetical protein